MCVVNVSPESLGSSGFAALVAACAVALVAGLSPMDVQAQDLPSADQLESDDSGGSSPFEETSAASDDEEGETSADQETEADSQQADQETEADREESAETSGQASADEESQESSEESEVAEESPEAEGKAAAEQTAETAEKTASGETAGEQGQGEEGEDTGRGELIETKTDTEKRVEGRGSAEGDVRWVQSGLNAHGVPGLQHLASAAPRLPNTYDVSFFGEVGGGASVVRAQDSNNFVAGRLLVHAQIIEYFSANFAIGAQNNVNEFGRPQAMLSQGDMSLGVRGHYPATDFFSVAADVTTDVPTGFGSAGPSFAATSIRPRLLGSFALNPLVEDAQVPLDAHFNVGYRVDNTSETVPDDIQLTRVERYAHGISAYNGVEMGVGVEYDVPYVSPFASWNIDIPVGMSDVACGGSQSLQCLQEAGFGAYPNNLSFGLRGEPLEQLTLHAGVDVGLTSQDAAGVPVTAPYKVFLGASWQIDPRARVEHVTKTVEKTRLVREAPAGRIVGEIRNEESDLPVGGAQISYPETDRSPQMAGRDSGTFQSYAFDPDEEVTVRITHPNYETKEMEVTVGEEPKDVRFALVPKATKATFSGTVNDANGGPIAGATVVLDGPQTREVQTDSAGKFSVEVEAGSYAVGISAPDYVASRQSLDLQAGDQPGTTFSLEPGGNSSLVEVAEEKIEIEDRVAFATGTAQIDQASNDVLDAVASKLTARPDIDEIEVQGHTDDVGSKTDNMELSEKRAQAVVDYLVGQGIDAERLIAKGYGPEQPVVPNISERNRQLNRRVEFKILEQ